MKTADVKSRIRNIEYEGGLSLAMFRAAGEVDTHAIICQMWPHLSRGRFSQVQIMIRDVVRIFPFLIVSFSYGCGESGAVLHEAVKSCDAQKVKAAIDRGANVEVLSKDGLTPLAQAALCLDPGVVKLLVDAGAKVDAPDAERWTPLMYAQDETVVAALLEAGANVNATNIDGETPLMFAKDAAIARRLIEAGADLRARNKAGKTALDIKKEQSASGRNAYADDIVAVIQEAEARDD